MPTYDYECPSGHRFEVFQKMSDEPGADCPDCGAPAQRKISGGAGFLFKGDGFYITDYRSDEYKKRASAEGPKSETKSGGSGGEQKSEGGSSPTSGTPESSKPATDA